MVTRSYQIQIDFGQDGTFGHALSDITALIEMATWNTGMNEPYQEYAPPSRLTLMAHNENGEWWQDNAGSAFYGLLKRGLLVRVRETYNSTTTTLWTGKLSGLPLPPMRYQPVHRTQLVAEDPMLSLLDAEYMPRLNTNVRIDTEIARVLSGRKFVWPYGKGHFIVGYSRLGVDTLLPDPTTWLDLQAAQTTLAYAGEGAGTSAGVSVQGYLNELVMSEMGGRFFWQGRTAKFTFHDRQYDVRNNTSAATLTGADLHESTPNLLYFEDVDNAVTVSYTLRALGAAGTVIWEASGLPIELRPGKSRTFTARYQDPDNPAMTTSATGVIPPVQMTDYTANSASNGTGTDYTAFIGLSCFPGADAARITLVNPTTLTLYVTSLQLRGTPLLANDRQQITIADADSIAVHGRRELKVDVPMVDDVSQVETYARILLQGRKTALHRLPAVVFRADQSDALMAQAVARTVGDRIRINLSGDGWTAHDREYVIVGERHAVVAATGEHLVTWTLKPAARAVGWILGKSRLGIDTVLTF